VCGSSYNQHCSGKPLVLTKLAQHPSLPCALLRIFSYLNPFSELLSLFPSLSAFVTIPLSLSFCHYSPSLSASLSRGMPAGEWQIACANGRKLFLNPKKLIEKKREREENENVKE